MSWRWAPLPICEISRRFSAERDLPGVLTHEGLGFRSPAPKSPAAKHEVTRLHEFEQYRDRLKQFYGHDQNDAYVEGDDSATTFESIGVVLMASLLSGSRSPVLLAQLTGLPEQFAAEVIRLMNFDDFWHSEDFAELERTFRNKPDDYADVGHAQYWVLVEVWFESRLPRMESVLEEARQRRIFGGAFQHWIDDEELDAFLDGGLADSCEAVYED